MNEIWFRVNCGYGAVQDGGVSPISQMFALAEAAGGRVETGWTYGEDMLVVPAENADLVEEMLKDIHMPYVRYAPRYMTTRFYLWESKARGRAEKWSSVAGPYPSYAKALQDLTSDCYIGDHFGHDVDPKFI